MNMNLQVDRRIKLIRRLKTYLFQQSHSRIPQS